MKRVDHPTMVYRGVFTKKQVIERVRVKGCMFGLVLDNNIRLLYFVFVTDRPCSYGELLQRRRSRPASGATFSRKNS